jgi:hypothetical protein
MSKEATHCFHFAADGIPVQGCQIRLGTTYQNGKNIPNIHNKRMPNGRKIDQMSIKYCKRPHLAVSGHFEVTLSRGGIGSWQQKINK